MEENWTKVHDALARVAEVGGGGIYGVNVDQEAGVATISVLLQDLELRGQTKQELTDALQYVKELQFRAFPPDGVLLDVCVDLKEVASE